MPNKYHNHLLIVPEDDANRQIANGFLQHPSVRQRSVQVQRVAGGWGNVGPMIADLALASLTTRHVVGLVDFDKVGTRRETVLEALAAEVRERVFVLGVWTEPEDLRRSTGQTLEGIGHQLADDCNVPLLGLWNHQLLKHNLGEVERLIARVRQFVC